MLVEEIYQRIADIINNAITENWLEATALLRRAEKVVGFTGNYINNQGENKALEGYT